MSPSRLLLLALCLMMPIGLALAAAQPLPVIVTYEMQRRREAEIVQRRNPKAFWVRQIVARLEDKKPVSPLGLAQPATAQVMFRVGRDGRILSQVIVKSSGVPAVDKEAEALLARAQPFPPMPAAMTEPDLSFDLPLRFR